MATDSDTSGISLPPPVVCLVAVLVGLGLDWMWPLQVLSLTPQYVVGFAIIAVSLILFGWCLWAFARFKTSVNHRRPTTAIVATGPYGLSRNPIYLSMALLMFGIAIAVDSVWLLLTMVAAMLVIHFHVVLREEVYLDRKFGDEYRTYKSAVRRWI